MANGFMIKKHNLKHYTFINNNANCLLDDGIDRKECMLPYMYLKYGPILGGLGILAGPMDSPLMSQSHKFNLLGRGDPVHREDQEVQQQLNPFQEVLEVRQ